MKQIDATISNLTVQQACASFHKAVKNGNEERAKALKYALRLATKPLREALDKARAKLHAKGRSPQEYEVMKTAEANLLADLDAIKAVLDYQPPEAAPALSALGQALAGAGVGAPAN